MKRKKEEKEAECGLEEVKQKTFRKRQRKVKSMKKDKKQKKKVEKRRRLKG